MIAERIYAVRAITGYVVLCDDGEYHRTTPSLRVLTETIQRDYVPRRIGRGAEDITDTSEGRTMLATINERRTSQRVAAVRARWGEERAPSKQIRVDSEAAHALEAVPERDRRRVASTAIVEAVRRYTAT